MKNTADCEVKRERIHGPQGTCDALVEAVHAFRDIRLDLEYGDYLAIACRKYRTNEMSDMMWKTHPEMDWQDVEAEMATEDRDMKEWIQAQRRGSSAPAPPTPWLDDLARAAARLGMKKTDVRFEIASYAKRNSLVHSNVESLILEARFAELATHIVRDKENLNKLYGDNPRIVIDYRLAIGRLESEWFNAPSFRNHDGIVRCIPSEKARKREVKLFKEQNRVVR